MIDKIKKWIEKRSFERKHVITSVMGLALVFAFGLGVFAFRGAIFTQAGPERAQEDAMQPQSENEVTYRHPLTGEALDEQIEPPHVFGVMIDHSADAWPQAGIEEAFLVYEAPVEGSIPRLLAFFSEEVEVDKIGPVRSARPYFVQWNDALDGMYVHVGGSPDALDIIASGPTFDFNQFRNGWAFWRSTRRYAPHNVYTSTDLLKTALERFEQSGVDTEPLYASWKYKKDDPIEGDQAIEPTVQFAPGASSYAVTWRYDAKKNAYKRMQGVRAYQTEAASEVFASNVIVIESQSRVLDRVGRLELKTIGQGDATIFQDGGAIEVTWQKDTVGQRVRFIDESGEEVSLNAGVTWVQIVDAPDKLSYEQEAE